MEGKSANILVSFHCFPVVVVCAPSCFLTGVLPRRSDFIWILFFSHQTSYWDRETSEDKDKDLKSEPKDYQTKLLMDRTSGSYCY